MIKISRVERGDEKKSPPPQKEIGLSSEHADRKKAGLFSIKLPW